MTQTISTYTHKKTQKKPEMIIGSPVSLHLRWHLEKANSTLPAFCNTHFVVEIVYIE